MSKQQKISNKTYHPLQFYTLLREKKLQLKQANQDLINANKALEEFSNNIKADKFSSKLFNKHKHYTRVEDAGIALHFAGIVSWLVTISVAGITQSMDKIDLAQWLELGTTVLGVGMRILGNKKANDIETHMKEETSIQTLNELKSNLVAANKKIDKLNGDIDDILNSTLQYVDSNGMPISENENFDKYMDAIMVMSSLSDEDIINYQGIEYFADNAEQIKLLKSGNPVILPDKHMILPDATWLM